MCVLLTQRLVSGKAHDVFMLVSGMEGRGRVLTFFTFFFFTHESRQAAVKEGEIPKAAAAAPLTNAHTPAIHLTALI